MTLRRAVTGILLAFVAASLAFLVVKEFRRTDPGAAAPAPATTPPEIGERTGGAPAGPRASLRLIAYYFVGKVRCSTCRKIEAAARSAIAEGFPQELKDGRVQFLVVDVDRPENRHFVDLYRLDSSTLVLVDIRDGRTDGWRALPDVWTLADDPDRLSRHVREQVAARLKGA